MNLDTYPRLVKARLKRGSDWYRGVQLGPKAQVDLNMLDCYRRYDEGQLEIVELTVVEDHLPEVSRVNKDVICIPSSSIEYYAGDDTTFYGINKNTIEETITQALNDLRELIACKLFLYHEDNTVVEQRATIEQIGKALDDDRAVSDEDISILLKAIKSGRFKVVEDV